MKPSPGAQMTVQIQDDGTVRMRAADGALVEVAVTKAELHALRCCDSFEERDGGAGGDRREDRGQEAELGTTLRANSLASDPPLMGTDPVPQGTFERQGHNATTDDCDLGYGFCGNDDSAGDAGPSGHDGRGDGCVRGARVIARGGSR